MKVWMTLKYKYMNNLKCEPSKDAPIRNSQSSLVQEYPRVEADTEEKQETPT